MLCVNIGGQMRIQNVLAYAIIQLDDNIKVMIWLSDNIAIVIWNYMTGNFIVLSLGWMIILLSTFTIDISLGDKINAII